MRFAISLVFGWLSSVPAAVSQVPRTSEVKISEGYTIHQSIDLGGRIVNYSGSGAVYDTLVNLHSGPRILSQTLNMRAAENTHHRLFDTLTSSTTGDGGDPEGVSALRISKGKIYDFRGLFRRDRQYFDYNLFDNPLVPAGVASNGYTFPQVANSPHLFNTVRRMMDTNVAILPLSKVSFRAGFSHNINQGPSFSSQHNGAEALYLQNWRNSTDSWLGAIDWKPLKRTSISFEENVTHYKGDTSWQLAGANLQLANGTPVTLGFDNVSAPVCGDGKPAIVNSSTGPATANATCNGYISYSRLQPTRSLFPTEEFLFQSAYFERVQMNGRVRYTGGNSHVPNYYENFNGLDNMGTRIFTTTGHSSARRINVSADYGITWQVAPKWTLSNQYDFWNFRQPADGYTSEVDQTGTSMLAPPTGVNPPTITAAHTFLGMKTSTDTTTVAWQASPRASISLGYRYRARTINYAMPLVTDFYANGTAYSIDIHQNTGLLGFALRPTREWKINADVEAAYANRIYNRTDPRVLLQYQVRSTYKPKPWATFSGTFYDLERRDNVEFIHHLDHSRSASTSAAIAPNIHYSVDLSYGYMDVFSRTDICYAATPAPNTPGAGAAPADCGTNSNLGNAYYDAPTQYGLIGISLTPVKTIQGRFGYRMSAVNGTTEFLNPRQVSGSLQSQYQSPYAGVAWTVHSGWIAKADWNYYGYGEGTPIGPTSPRSFRGNLYTLAMHYEF